MYHLVKSIYLHATSLPEYSVLLLGLDAAGKTTLLNQIKSVYNTSQSGGGNNTSVTSIFPSLLSGGADAAEPHAKSDDDATPSVGRTVPTVGQNVATVRLDDCYLKIWDVGGQQSLRGLWASYYRSCHAIVFVVDSTDVGEGDLSWADVQQMGAKSASSAQSGGGSGDARPGDDEDDASSGRLRECAAVLTAVLGHADAHGVPLLVLANKQDREDSIEVVRIKEGLVRAVVEGRSGAGVRDSRVLPCSALRGTGVREAVEWVRSRVKWNREVRAGVMR